MSLLDDRVTLKRRGEEGDGEPASCSRNILVIDVAIS